MTDPETVPVVTCFLRAGADVLLLRRSDAVGSYRGRWGAVAGHVAPGPGEGEGSGDDGAESARDPGIAARREIEEETGLGDAVTLVRAGEPFPVVDRDRGTRWLVHPFLFDCDRRAVEPNDETTEWEWVSPVELPERETVPDLARSYVAVAPTVEAVREDREHGSASLSVRALEVLRDRAAGLTAANPDWATLADVARALRAARPGMAAVRNRVNRAMASARGHADAPVPDGTDPRSPEAVRAAAEARIDAALDADDRAAAVAADRIDGERVATLSRSGTVLAALRRGAPRSVLVAESRPGGEGAAVARELADDGLDATLTTDAAAPGMVARDRDGESADGDGPRVDAVLVGADAVLPDGTVVNKVGTHAVALAAVRAGVPVYAVCARDKVSPDPEFDPEDAGPIEGDDGPLGGDGVASANPTFEATPPDLVTGVLTEDGVLDADAIREVAEQYRKLAAWAVGDRETE